MTKKIRPLGDITAEMEPLLEEFVDIHELQRHEILALVRAWLETHRPYCLEEFIEEE